MFKRTHLNTKGSLLLIALLSTVTASSFVHADQSNIDAQGRNAMQGAQIPSRGQNIEAGTFVESQQYAQNLILGSANIKNAVINVAAGTYINPHQLARNVMIRGM